MATGTTPLAVTIVRELIPVLLLLVSLIFNFCFAKRAAKYAGEQQRETEETKAKKSAAALREHTRVLCLLELDNIKSGYSSHALNTPNWENAHRRLEERSKDPDLARAFTPGELLMLLKTIDASGFHLAFHLGAREEWKLKPDMTLQDTFDAIEERMKFLIESYKLLFLDVFDDAEVVADLRERQDWQKLNWELKFGHPWPQVERAPERARRNLR